MLRVFLTTSLKLPRQTRNGSSFTVDSEEKTLELQSYAAKQTKQRMEEEVSMKKVTQVALHVVIGALALASTTTVCAFDLGDIVIHGFVTQSYIKTTENQMFGMNTVDGSFDWFEAGINFSTEPVEGLRIGLQLYARELGPQGNEEIKIDWAMGDYRWKDELGFRIGKVKLPFGLFNEVRDADMARPSILLPQAIYSENLRELINAYLGGEIYGTLSMGGAGDLSYRLFGGTMNLDGAYVIERFMRNGAESGMRSLPFPLAEPNYTISNIRANMDHIYGGELQWHTPVDGLRFNITYHTSESHFSNLTTYSGWMGQVPASINLTTSTSYESLENVVLSTEYRAGKLHVVGEYWWNDIRTQNTIGGLPFPMPQMPAIEEGPIAYYGQVAYRVKDWLQLSGYYSEFFKNRGDKDGDALVARGQPAYYGWSKEFSATARFDISQSWVFKIEGHFYDGGATAQKIDNPDGIEKDWSMLIGRFSFYF
jgi:hypothetical protein